MKWTAIAFALAALWNTCAGIAVATTWNVSADFSATLNPTGAWTYGSKQTVGGTLTAYNNTTLVPAAYGSQIKGWSSNSNAIPYLLKNVSATDWVYNGVPVGGGVGTVHPGEVLLHPYSPADLMSVARWTAPSAGSFLIDATFTRFEDFNATSNYVVAKNGMTVPSGAGVLVGFGDSNSTAHFATTLALLAGDRVEFMVGHNNDSSDTDGTILAATLTTVPEPSSLVLAGLGFAGLAWKRARTRFLGSLPFVAFSFFQVDDL